MDELRIEREVENESVDEGEIGDVVDDQRQKRIKKRCVNADCREFMASVCFFLSLLETS